MGALDTEIPAWMAQPNPGLFSLQSEGAAAHLGQNLLQGFQIGAHMKAEQDALPTKLAAEAVKMQAQAVQNQIAQVNLLEKQNEIIDSKTFSDAQTALNLGEDPDVNFRTTKYATGWEAFYAKSKLGRAMTSDIAQFEKSLAGLDAQGRAAVIAQPKTSNGMPSQDMLSELDVQQRRMELENPKASDPLSIVRTTQDFKDKINAATTSGDTATADKLKGQLTQFLNLTGKGGLDANGKKADIYSQRADRIAQLTADLQDPDLLDEDKAILQTTLDALKAQTGMKAAPVIEWSKTPDGQDMYTFGSRTKVLPKKITPFDKARVDIIARETAQNNSTLNKADTSATEKTRLNRRQMQLDSELNALDKKYEAKDSSPTPTGGKTFKDASGKQYQYLGNSDPKADRDPSHWKLIP